VGNLFWSSGFIFPILVALFAYLSLFLFLARSLACLSLFLRSNGYVYHVCLYVCRYVSMYLNVSEAS